MALRQAATPTLSLSSGLHQEEVRSGSLLLEAPVSCCSKPLIHSRSVVKRSKTLAATVLGRPVFGAVCVSLVGD